MNVGVVVSNAGPQSVLARKFATTWRLLLTCTLTIFMRHVNEVRKIRS
jgi:hypothetical protein